MFYFSVLFDTNPSFRFRLSDIKYFILPGVFLIVLLLQRRETIESDSTFFDFLGIIYISLILIQALFYTGLSYFTIRNIRKEFSNFRNTEGINLNWLEYIILIIFTINIIYIIYNIFYDSTSNFFINTAFLIVIYFVAYYSLKQKEIYPVEEKQREELISH
ncbi:hypothetical protein [Chryseobacterium wanjuense]